MTMHEGKQHAVTDPEPLVEETNIGTPFARHGCLWMRVHDLPKSSHCLAIVAGSGFPATVHAVEDPTAEELAAGAEMIARG